jgi:hypothetical protein
VYWSLAWCELEFYYLGFVLCSNIVSGKNVDREDFKESSSGFWLVVYVCVGKHWLVVFSGK